MVDSSPPQPAAPSSRAESWSTIMLHRWRFDSIREPDEIHRPRDCPTHGTPLFVKTEGREPQGKRATR